MNDWEHQYRNAVADITSPATLDEKILQRAKQFRPPQTENRWLSRAAGGCTALAVMILLVHPAQYLGALTPELRAAKNTQASPLHNWQPESAPQAAPDPWFDLRSQVQAGSYMELCRLWRRQQQGTLAERLPRDLENKAKTHCRLLPVNR
ncbi:hypothetical protein [Microbulbifer thermotolerans]|uniref:hypothetical protein n=1 Tax=Microbulbifer thermotolerans TaxID=252514 RepID=UPI00224A7662|nr:hypothetical protein [Microbulbifer thermotolerans]MCX2779840.1 hypothetical protein [Microbulbifer thermotolerans]MCX2805147.1 hypothetical protein [Microbulbifer thermotolerans]MCX2834630.1 hypothetical protein [Microbulbifer thermotolerans]